jgi:hypothetical protein
MSDKYLTHRQLVALFPDTVHISVTLHTRATEVAKRMFDKLTTEGSFGIAVTPPFQYFSVEFGKFGNPGYRTVDINICDPNNWEHLKANPETCEPAELPEPIALQDETTKE